MNNASIVPATSSVLIALLNSSPAGHLACHSIRDVTGDIVDFQVVFANAKAVADFGFASEAVQGESIGDLLPYLKTSNWWSWWQAAARSGKSSRQPTDTLLLPRVTGTGTALIESWEAGFLLTYNIDEIVAPDHKPASSTATDNALVKQLRAVMDISQTGLFQLEPVWSDQKELVDFRLINANRTLAAYVDKEPQALTGELFSRWFPGYKTSGLFDHFCQVYEQNQPYRFDYRIDTNGDAHWLDILACRYNDEVLVTFLDVTDSKQIQHQLEATVQQLRSSNENLEQFAYIASHDLQEPLRKLQAFGDVLQSQFADSLSDGEVDLVRRIQKSAKRMQTLVRDLLTYSRLSTETEPFEDVILSRLIDEVLVDLEVATTENRAVIRVEPLPNLLGSIFRLRQLFQNLILNAIRFRKPDQSPVIRISARYPPLEEVPSELLGQIRAGKLFVLVEITDNGIGFDARYKDRIFQPFQRLQNHAHGGTGIGLAICRKVAESHGGAIDASSQPGVGSVFKVFLPVYGPNAR